MNIQRYLQSSQKALTMKLLISLLLIQKVFANTPIIIYGNNSEQLQEVTKSVSNELKVPQSLITSRFEKNPCHRKNNEQNVLTLCLEGTKLKVLQKNEDLLNNAYRVFRKK